MGVRIQELPETTGINKEDVLIVEDGQGTKKGTVKQLDEALGVSQLKEDKVDKPSVDDDGKIPRAKGGEVEWVDVGQPTDEQTNSAVSSWLNEHPEATTTVQDGSITEHKINVDFLPYIKNEYVTPEMFGAVGDGVTDDTEAIQNAIDNSGRVPVIFKNKKYRCNGTLLLNYGTQLVGCGERVNPTILYYTGTGVFITQNSPETNGSSYYSDCSDISIKNLRLEGTNKDGTTALYLVHGSNIRTDDLRIVKFDNGVFLGSQRNENDKYIDEYF